MYNDDIKFIIYIKSMKEDTKDTKDTKYPNNLPDNVKDYFESNPMPKGVQDYLFPILNKHNEELEREEIHKLENEITMSVSAISVKDFKKLIDKVKKNCRELGLSVIKSNKKDAITVVFMDNSWNEMEIAFKFVEYVDKGVSIFISPYFKYWPLIDSDFEDFLKKNNPQSPKLRKMDHKTKVGLLTNIRNLIASCKNS